MTTLIGYKFHPPTLSTELGTLKFNTTDPFGKVDNTSTCWLDEDRAAERRTLETEITKRHVKFHFLLRQLFHLLAETFKC